LKSNNQLLTEILAETKKQTALVKKWVAMDKDYHDKTLASLDKNGKKKKA
jgi:hypothetical protein